MTREQQIDIATLEFVSAMCRHCAIKADCNDVDAYCTEHDAQELGFTAGANWADEHPKNVWHDASEKPNRHKPILIQCGYPLHTYEATALSEDVIWGDFVVLNAIFHWAYIADLLPKGGEL